MTLTPINSTYANFFRAANTGGSAYKAYTWDISNGCPYNVTLATVAVSPVNFPLIGAAETGLQVKEAYTGGSTVVDYLDNFSLIPAHGSISSSYLSREGLHYGEQTISVSLNQSALTVNPDNITRLECNGLTLTNIQRTGSYRFSCTAEPAGNQYGSVSLSVVVTNPASGKECRVAAGIVKVRLHLAVCGVRTNIVWDGNRGTFRGAALFASKYQGSESTRYQDWPSAAKQLKDNFRSGRSHQKCVAPASGSQLLEQQGGVGWAYSDVGGNAYGTGITLYTIRYVDNGSFGGLINSHYQTFTPYQRLFAYQQNGEQGTQSTYLVFGDIWVHLYANLYPDSKGWLTPGNDCEQFSF
jgi:hypothetical protein